MVETFAADSSDESQNRLSKHFARAIGVRSVWPRMPIDHGSAARRLDAYEGCLIPNEMSRRVVPRERLGDLARDPPPRLGFAVTPKPHPKSSSVAHNDKNNYRIGNVIVGSDKEVDRRERPVNMIAEKPVGQP